jgi:hypothetical protein
MMMPGAQLEVTINLKQGPKLKKSMPTINCKPAAGSWKFCSQSDPVLSLQDPAFFQSEGDLS